jgi:hypothetical protein
MLPSRRLSTAARGTLTKTSDDHQRRPTSEGTPVATSTAEPTASVTRSKDPLYSAVIGLATLAILLQAVWAGLFLRYDGKRDDSQNWVDAHGHGADVAIGLTVLALVVAFIRLRARKDLLVGTVLLLVLLIVESYLGGEIVDHGKDWLTAVHVPVAMLIMGVAVWLPLRSRTGARQQQG